jgi:hypothetical protein
MAASARQLASRASAFYIGSALFLGTGMVTLADQPLRPLIARCEAPESCETPTTDYDGVQDLRCLPSAPWCVTHIGGNATACNTCRCYWVGYWTCKA